MNQFEKNEEDQHARELQAFLKRVGVPTFKEYCALSDADRAKYKIAASNSFNQISNNKQPLNSVRKYKHIFVTRSGVRYDCGDNLEKIERIMIEEGLDHSTVDYKPEVRETETTGFYIEVTWSPKETLSV